MQKVSIDSLINGLKSISDDQFSCDNVYSFLGENPVDIDSISKYFFWRPDFYTRNLIYKDDRFELMAVCWEKGQASVVHDHSDQKCWMTVPVGRLRGQNFAVTGLDESKNFCSLVESDSFELSDCLAAKVELEQPIHQILNLPEFDERAVSIHIYSKPFNRCMAYDRETETYREVDLCYFSIGGKVVKSQN